jgi:predicted MFS family arabinose efflux permease
VTLLLLLLSFVLFWLIGWWLPGLIVGVILLDLGVQGTQVSNQTRIYGLRPDARSRITTIYMSTYFIGGALGSLLGGFAWETWGWSGVCSCGVILVVIALAIYWRPKAASR